MSKNAKTTTDAVAILHRRYVGDDPNRLRDLERERLHAKVARRIFEIRSAAGLTQSQLAEKIGTSQSVISRLEDADYEGHSLSMLRRVANALNAKLDVDFESQDLALAHEVREPAYRERRSAPPFPNCLDFASRLTREFEQAQEYLRQFDFQRELEKSSRFVLESLEQIQPSLAEFRQLAEEAALWQGLEKTEIARIQTHLRDSLREIASVAALASFCPSYDELLLALDTPNQAWSFLEDSSTTYALTAITALAKAIDTDPFSSSVVTALHSQLGDWTTIRLDDYLLDYGTRQDMYFRTGLEPRLVEPDSDVFDAILTMTRLRASHAPVLIPVYSPYDLQPLTEAAERSQQAVSDYGWLFRFESQLRAFIDRVLTEAVGPHWTHQRAHPEVTRQWKERQEEVQRGEVSRQEHQGLLSYADLGDLPKIICRNDNWPLFASYFRRKELVQESFKRLAPLRNDIAHSRALSQADRLYLHAEIHRLCVAFQTPPSQHQSIAR